MATSVFFNNFQSSLEQTLIEDLIIESIKIYGMEVIYVPRVTASYDVIFNEDDRPEYHRAIPIEMYIKNVDGFGGDGDFLSKFNIQIRDTITFTVARRSFFNEVAGDSSTSLPRPLEGDLIYFPLNKKVFKVTFVEHEDIFYQLGSLQTWDIRCELFEYSNEVFNTGVDDIDSIEWEYSLSTSPLALLASDYDFLIDEFGYSILTTTYDLDAADPLAQNEELETVADGFIDFTEIDPFSEGEY